MEISELYNTAKKYVANIKEKKSGYCSDSDNTITLIVLDTKNIISAVSTVSIENDEVKDIASEDLAVMMMTADSKFKASQIITVSIGDLKIVVPNEKCLEKLVQMSKVNNNCEVIKSEDEKVLISQLVSTAESSEGEFGAPAEFVSGFDFDDNNPFLDKESAEEAGEVPTIQNQNNGMQQGFNPNMQQGFNPNMQQGYNPNMMQQGYNPNMQQGYNPNMMQQGYNPNMQQGYNPNMMQQGYNPNMQQGYSQNMNNMMQADPYAQQQPYKSVHVGGTSSVYQNSEMVSSYLGKGGSAFKRRLGNFLGEEENAQIDAAASVQPLSKEELMRQAKEKKKAARDASKNQ